MSPADPPLRIEVDSAFGSGDVAEPRRLRIGHAVYEVVEIMDRWYEGPRRAGGPVRHYFKVRSRSAAVFLLVHDLATDTWGVVQACGPERPPGTSGPPP